MAYEIQLPNGHIVEVDDSVPRSVAEERIFRTFPDLFPDQLKRRQGFLPGAASGLGVAGGNIVRGVGETMYDLGMDGGDLVEVGRGIVGEAQSWNMPLTEKQKKEGGIGNLYRDYAGGLGNFAGMAVEGLTGPLSIPLFMADMRGANAARNEEKGTPEPDALTALAAAATQAVIARFGFGRVAGRISEPFKNKAVSEVAQALKGVPADEIMKAAPGVARNVVTGMLKNTAEMGTMMTGLSAVARAQGGENLADADAMEEYGHGLATAAKYAPIFGGLPGLMARRNLGRQVRRAEGEYIENENTRRSNIDEFYDPYTAEALAAQGASEANLRTNRAGVEAPADMFGETRPAEVMQMSAPTENMKPIIDPNTGKVIGYSPIVEPPKPFELERPSSQMGLFESMPEQSGAPELLTLPTKKPIAADTNVTAPIKSNALKNALHGLDYNNPKDVSLAIGVLEEYAHRNRNKDGVSLQWKESLDAVNKQLELLRGQLSAMEGGEQGSLNFGARRNARKQKETTDAQPETNSGAVVNDMGVRSERSAVSEGLPVAEAKPDIGSARPTGNRGEAVAPVDSPLEAGTLRKGQVDTILNEFGVHDEVQRTKLVDKINGDPGALFDALTERDPVRSGEVDNAIATRLAENESNRAFLDTVETPYVGTMPEGRKTAKVHEHMLTADQVGGIFDAAGLGVNSPVREQITKAANLTVSEVEAKRRALIKDPKQGDAYERELSRLLDGEGLFDTNVVLGSLPESAVSKLHVQEKIARTLNDARANHETRQAQRRAKLEELETKKPAAPAVEGERIESRKEQRFWEGESHPVDTVRPTAADPAKVDSLVGKWVGAENESSANKVTTVIARIRRGALKIEAKEADSMLGALGYGKQIRDILMRDITPEQAVLNELETINQRRVAEERAALRAKGDNSAVGMAPAEVAVQENIAKATESQKLVSKGDIEVVGARAGLSKKQLNQLKAFSLEKGSEGNNRYDPVKAREFLEANAKNESWRELMAEPVDGTEQASEVVKVAIGEKGATLNSVLDALIIEEGNSPLGVVAHAVRVAKTETTVGAETIGGRVPGIFDGAKDHIAVDTAIASHRTVVHEGVHAVTEFALNHPERLAPHQQQAVENLNALFGHVKTALGAEGEGLYGMKNIHEFVSEAHTNKSFQKILKEIEAPETNRSLYKKAWDWFVQSVSDLLGLKDSSVLYHVFEASSEIYNARPMERTDTAQFKQWFKKSEAVDAAGKPEQWYHGTARDIETFASKQVGAIFVTRDPKFTESFSNSSMNWMLNNAKDVLTPEQLQQAREAAKREVRKNETGLDRSFFLKQLDGDGWMHSGYARAQLREMMQTGENTMPVYVRAERPFDYENPSHVKAVVDILAKDGLTPDGQREMTKLLSEGMWTMIETPDVQAAIRSLGHDGFYIKEGSRRNKAGEIEAQKNLGVYDSNQLKSAIGNSGEYSLSDNRIHKAEPVKSKSDMQLIIESGTPAKRQRGAVGVVYDAVTGFKNDAVESMKGVPKDKLWQGVQAYISDLGYKIERRFGDEFVGYTRYMPYGARIHGKDGTTSLSPRALAQASNYASGVGEASLAIGKIAKNKEGIFTAQKHDANLESLTDAAKAIPGATDPLRAANSILTHLSQLEHEANRERAVVAAQERLNNAKAMMERAKSLSGKARDNLRDRARAEEREAKKDLERSPEYPRPAGMTEESIAAVKRQLAESPEVQRLAEINRQINMHRIDALQEGGIISKETADKWRENSHYSPMFREMDDNLTPEYRIHTNSAGNLKGFKGSERDVDVITNHMTQALWVANAVIKNQARHEGIKYFLENPEVGKQIGIERTGSGGDNVIKVKVKGEDQYYRIADGEAFLSFSGFRQELPAFLKPIEKITHMFREAIMLSPGAMIRNLTRDPMEAYMSNHMEGSLANAYTQSFKHLAGAMPSLQSGFSPTVNKIKEYGAFRHGLTGVRELTKNDREIDLIIQRAAREMGVQPGVGLTVNQIDGLLSRVHHKLQDVARAAEISTRETVYQDTLRRTGSEHEARMAAINTIDFRRRGASDTITYARALIPFFNSQVQGVYKMYRTLVRGDNTGMTKENARVALAINLTKMAAIATIYHAMMDELDPTYSNMRTDVKANKFIIPTGGDNPPIQLSIPFEIGAIGWSLPVMLTDTVKGKATWEELKKGVRTTLMHQTPNFIPTVVKPPMEMMTNYNTFTGRNIESTEMQHKDKRFRATDDTTGIAKAYGEATGTSPIMFDHVWNGYLGTLGKHFLGIADMMLGNNAGKADTPWHRTQAGKTLFADPDSTKYKEQFFSMKTKADEVASTYNSLLKAGRADELRKYLDEESAFPGHKNKEVIPLQKSLTQHYKAVLEIKKKAEIVKHLPSDKMTDEQKMIKLRELRKVENKLLESIVTPMRRFVYDDISRAPQ